MEVGPHLDLAIFTSSYGFLQLGLLSRGVSVCLYTIWCMKTQFMVVFTNSTIKQKYVEKIIKDVMNLFTVFLEAISAKILEHHEANPEFISVPQWSRQAISTFSSGSRRYLR